MKFKQAGFSLMELVLVIVIIGVLAVVAGPRFFSTDVYRDRFYAEDILAALRFARRAAESTNCSVRFRALANGFDLAQDTNCFNGGASNYSLPVLRPSESGAAYLSTEKPTTMIQSASTNTLFFQVDGGVRNSANNVVDVTFSLTGAEVIRTLTVDGGTGYVRSQ